MKYQKSPMNLNNREIESILNHIGDSSELAYISLLVMTFKLGKGSNIVPELALILDSSSLLNLLNYFSGETIKIPTTSELRDELLGLLAFYNRYIKGLSRSVTLRQIGFTDYGKNPIYNTPEKRQQIKKIWQLCEEAKAIIDRDINENSDTNK